MRALVLSAVLVLVVPAVARADVRFPASPFYAVGMQIKVRVDDARPTSFVFARLNDQGGVIRVLVRRSVRRDTVKLRFARGGRYLVRVGSVRRTFDVCGAGGGTAELRVLNPVVSVGGTVAFRLVNTSRNHACLTAGPRGGWVEQLGADATWSVAAWGPGSTELSAIMLTPWAPYDKRIALPLSAGPGVYRVRDGVTRSVDGRSEPIPLSAEFTVRP
jgi:hypothetical protein